MDKIKLILITIAVVLGSLGLLAVIGLVSSLIQSLFWIGVLCLAGYVGVKLLVKDKPHETDSLNVPHTLKQVERTLEEYRRKLK
jgi:predicted tellurium resistance membrane protein TerC